MKGDITMTRDEQMQMVLDQIRPILKEHCDIGVVLDCHLFLSPLT